MASDQEIPDNVTAELEKLEQETGKKNLLVLIKFYVTWWVKVQWRSCKASVRFWAV